MDLSQYQTITNHFQDVSLISLQSWSVARDIQPRDANGPYVIVQEGFDPNDLTMTPDEFVLGRSGQWLATKFFYRLPVAERRAEFVFGTAAEVMTLMQSLSPNPVVMRPGREPEAGASAQPDEMVTTFLTSKQGKSGERPS